MVFDDPDGTGLVLQQTAQGVPGLDDSNQGLAVRVRMAARRGGVGGVGLGGTP